MKKTYKTFIVLALLSLLYACSKDDYKPLKGSMVGFVKIFDENGYEIKDKSEVLVELEGTNHKALTNETGRFEIENIPAGTYDVRYSKNGFGQNYSFSRKFVGNGVPYLLYEIRLYKQPELEITDIEATYNDGEITVVFKNPALNDYTEYDFGIDCFMSLSSDISIDNYQYVNNRKQISNYLPYIYSDRLEFTSFKEGETVYILPFFYNPNEEYGYPPRERNFSEYKKSNLRTSYKRISDPIKLKLE